jgi:acyl-CoA dehydrogenase
MGDSFANATPVETPATTSRMPTMNFEHTTRAVGLQAQLIDFMTTHVYPAEHLYREQIESGHRYRRPPILEDLKRRARERRGCGIYSCPASTGPA